MRLQENRFRCASEYDGPLPNSGTDEQIGSMLSEAPTGPNGEGEDDDEDEEEDDEDSEAEGDDEDVDDGSGQEDGGRDAIRPPAQG